MDVVTQLRQEDLQVVSDLVSREDGEGFRPSSGQVVQLTAGFFASEPGALIVWRWRGRQQAAGLSEIPLDPAPDLAQLGVIALGVGAWLRPPPHGPSALGIAEV